MKFLVITLAPTIRKEEQYYSYAPYVKEMNIWFSQVSNITILSPANYSKEILLAPFSRKDLKISSIPNLDFTSVKSFISSVWHIPGVIVRMFSVMKNTDHIHLRCPGNIGLIACLVQILFPKKQKTAKYAGNWDPDAKQPISYRIQKWILSNTFLSRNMQVMVYGDWPNQSINIKPFFTASYNNDRTGSFRKKEFRSPYQFIFVGSLSSGKRPLYAIQLIEELHLKGIECKLDLFGDGDERITLENYIDRKGLTEWITINGNQSAHRVEKAYQESDFLILASRSEGWPKAVAEAMFWGVIPVVTGISCVPWMIGHGKRGILVNAELNKDGKILEESLQNRDLLKKMSEDAQKWSHQYTLDEFENEIKKLLK